MLHHMLSEVTTLNQGEVFERKFSDVLAAQRKGPKYKIGDEVRIQVEKKSPLSKGFTQSFSDETFFVSKVCGGDGLLLSSSTVAPL